MKTATWAEGDEYERYVGRWSRLVADIFLDWLACQPGSRWLDVGCGTGALTRNIDVPTRFEDSDDYWAPFLGGQGPAPGYAVGLEAPARDILRDLLKRKLPADSHGRISLTARALAARGSRRRA